MIFAGFQKLTLLDDPTHVSCTLFTQGCTFKCPFCHNSELIDINAAPFEHIEEDEVLSFLKKRQGILDSVSITGGEPLMQTELPAFLRKVKDLGFDIKLDTNGHFPERLRETAEAGLIDRVAMDIKNCPGKYAETIGLENFDLEPIKQSIAFLKGGSLPFEFRTTVVREFHTAEDMKEIAQWLEGTENYFLQGFVDSGNVLKSGLHAVSKEGMDRFAEIMRPYIPKVALRGV
ncbi:MAG: anaerobic ribonucleoside-triphosphate reductase activating protein [Clostridia bacterium]|nr:anaerobic ribonucleoside-triphosphate reductase activating protein [Clostridia bacterium]